MCSDAGYEVIEGAETKAIAASVVVAAGAALVVTGIVLAVAGGSGDDAATLRHWLVGKSPWAMRF